MDWTLYQKRFKISARKRRLPDDCIVSYLDYAKNLYDKNLPIIFDIEHLSRLLGYKTRYLYSVTNNYTKSYRIYEIPKHNKKTRTIIEPFPDLKKIQSWILKNILEKVSTSIYAKAYKPDYSLKDNVRFHVKQPVVIKLDVLNFFPSINQDYVIKLFIQLGYSKSLAGLLGRLCCYKGELPQGAPTSPYISNLYCSKLDKRIGTYVTKLGFRYTRYSDDITISGNISYKQIGSIIRFCKRCLSDNKLRLNNEKTQILRPYHRQVVTGIILNEKISAGTKRKKEVRKQIYYIKKYGLESHIKHEKIDKQNYLYHLAGLVNWVLFLEKKNKEFLKYKQYMLELTKYE